MSGLIAGLVILGVAALVFVVWPIFAGKADLIEDKTDQQADENIRLFKEALRDLEQQKNNGRLTEAEFSVLKLEQERALLADEASKVRGINQSQGSKWVLIVLAALLLLSAVALYVDLGYSQDVKIQLLNDEKRAHLIDDFTHGREPNPEVTRALIEQISDRLEKDPENTQYWFMLARNYMELSDFEGASKAYDEVVKRDAQSSTVLAEAAQALFLRQDKNVTPQLISYVEQSLAIDPQNTVALGLSGIIGFSQQNYQRAIDEWNKVIQIVGLNAPSAVSLKSGIERAKELMAESGQTPAESASQSQGDIQLPIAITLDKAIDASPNAVAFVYARAWQGSKMPLAITKVLVNELPNALLLTESMAMSPAATLSSVSQVEVVVRISESGSATPEAGDWQGSVGPIDLANIPSKIQVVVDKKL